MSDIPGSQDESVRARGAGYQGVCRPENPSGAFGLRSDESPLPRALASEIKDAVVKESSDLSEETRQSVAPMTCWYPSQSKLQFMDGDYGQ